MKLKSGGVALGLTLFFLTEEQSPQIEHIPTTQTVLNKERTVIEQQESILLFLFNIKLISICSHIVRNK